MRSLLALFPVFGPPNMDLLVSRTMEARVVSWATEMLSSMIWVLEP